MVDSIVRETLPLPFHLFDRRADVWITERRRPHWSQAGTVCFLVWRTVDSMPQKILDRWFDDRSRWLSQHGICPADPNWRTPLERLGPEVSHAFLQQFWNRWHDALDAGHGECILRRPELSAIVAESLRHFDGQRYELLDFVVMPNHVHVLAAFFDQQAMLAQCESWKHHTAGQINRRIGRKGRFWQTDAFDHLVRTEEQF